LHGIVSANDTPFTVNQEISEGFYIRIFSSLFIDIINGILKTKL
jgi:hypothetical protein